MQFLLSKSLRRLSRLYSRSIAKELPDLQIEYKLDVILLLASKKEHITQKEMAKILQIDKSRMAIIVGGLNQSNYIYTERNPADRREHFVFLTDKGKEIVPVIQAGIERVNDQINKQLDKQHLDYFYYTLLQMELNLTGKAIEHQR